MKFSAARLALLMALLWSLGPAPAHAQSLPPGGEEDQTTVFRPHLEVEGAELLPVPAEEIKPGFAYNYYNTRLSRRVWGLAREDGTFQYAFGEGTTLPVGLFDLRISQEVERRRLEQAAPGLRQQLATTGSTPAVRMSADGTWKLLPLRSIASVFDLQTGHRWEWHGQRRVAVLHFSGDQWQMVDGRYRPLGGGYLAIPYHACGTFHRVGSAAYVERTPEAE